MNRPELVVLSHLPWTFVWQRPQHLVSRLARGRRARFVEECKVVPGLDQRRLCVERHAPVTRVWLEVGDEPRLAADLPVVSTRVPDVVAEFGAVADLRDDAAGFAAACAP